MSELAHEIVESDDFWCGEGVDVRRLAIYKIELKRQNLPELPEAFAAFCKECNGVRGSGSCLWGLNPDGPFEDILTENLRLEMAGSGALILGYNDLDYLFYDAELARYQTRDKDSLELAAEFSDWEEAVAEILQL